MEEILTRENFDKAFVGFLADNGYNPNEVKINETDYFRFMFFYKLFNSLK